ncbi:MAG: putative selenium-dependent hydroxylase accessory protein YqeC [Deltaproteobacteria bacterium]|nr:putative selenium-dependent hydroxylase accessory protein YqeC [Deltaproteobacteria bacterium]
MNREQLGNMSGSLSEALGLQRREMISLTGAGGKTTLMFRLAKELSLQGKKVITTTTTKILKPNKDEGPHLFVSQDEGKIKEFVSRCLDQYGHITLAKEDIGGGKLKGISQEFADILWNLYDMDAFIIEADGAAGMPVKAPREGEPVIPLKTTLVVALLGLDGVGRELNDQNVFQSKRISKLTGISEDEKMTTEGMALLMTHREGLFKGAPVSSRWVAFLNKVDVPGGIAKAKEIARDIFEKKDVKIERVVLGELKSETPVVEVIFP